jgi:hypothetical protein
MDRVLNIVETVAQVVAEYECPSPVATMYYVHDEKKRIDLVLVVPNDRTIEPHIVVMTRLDGEQVIVETDTTDRPLDEALMASGIPRRQVIVAWRGETAAV